MPWQCPACQTLIQHSQVESEPRYSVVYRCHICRLELVFDPDASKLTLAPLPDAEPNTTMPPREKLG